MRKRFLHEAAADKRARAEWLLTASLLIAVLVALIPAEAGFVYMYIRRHDAVGFLMAKCIFLAAILFPLVAYFLVNGRSYAILFGHWRTRIVITIVALHLFMNALAWFR